MDARSFISAASLYHLRIFCHPTPSPQFSNLLDTSGDGAIIVYIILGSEQILLNTCREKKMIIDPVHKNGDVP